MSQRGEYVDMEPDASGVYSPVRSNYAGANQDRGYEEFYRTPYKDPAFAGALGDVYDLIAEVIDDVTAGNRGRVLAEALIIAGVVPDPKALRSVAAENGTIERFMQEVDIRALVNLIGRKSEEQVDQTLQTVATHAATFAAGYGAKILFDKLRG